MLRRFSIHDEFRDAFLTDGCVVLTDLHTPQEVSEVRDEIFQIFELRLGAFNPRNLKGNDLLMELHTSEPDAWRQAARRMQTVPSASRLASKRSIVDVMRKVGLEMPIIAPFPEPRTDMPGDVTYRQPWHQDWRSGQGSWNSITFWTPLHDVSAQHGAIEAIPGSHLWGLVPIIEYANPVRFETVDDRIGKDPSYVAELKAGECLMFSQMLVHRSGFNSSGMPRLTCQLRYSDAAERHFIDNGYRAASMPEYIWEKSPDVDAMHHIYGR